ncbi:MAG: hypothetical protein HGN29_16770 [Asgard group archaeon]|nr:hypothetical protein [Asgard group archaeon]
MLLKIKEDNLPLFIVMDNQNQCYIINNQIVGYRMGGWAGHYPFNAFYQLHRLFDKPITRKVFPKQLLRFFTESSDLPPDFHNSFLIGDLNDYFHHVVSLETEINEQLFAPVILYNIYYKNHQKRLEFEPINLTAKEAFLIFSNILTNDRLYFYDSKISFEDTNITSTFHPYHYKSYGEHYHRLAHFGHNYLLYLRDELLSKSLTPYEVAFHGGIRLLCFLNHLKPVRDFACKIIAEIEEPDNLSRNRKIVYYCFLNALSFYSSLGSELELDEFTLNEKLEQLINKKF